ncbi:MAG: CRISPR-associated endonuclease Cas1 [Candidatus Omnitrophica bacterium]|nr:CRISPR-associated endonuclease Cas1 [Candidatus Omnitrophota bacterium]
MQLILNTYGAYLHQADGIFEVKAGEKKTRVSPKKVQSIVMTTGVSLSSDAVQLAVENNIDILFLDYFGNPYGRVWHGRLGSTARIRRAQLEFALSDEGLKIGQKFVDKKFDNQIVFLRNLRDRRTAMSAEITAAINMIKDAREKLMTVEGNANEMRGSIMGIEGQAGRRYWMILSRLLPERFRFNGRSRNPAQDEFNCLLNYAYGVLYGIVERACVLAGIDPYVGFIHTDHYAKTSMVFDVIEGYRIFADETVFNLFSRKKVKKALFNRMQNGFVLNKEGKAVLLVDYNEYLDNSILYNGRRLKRRDTIQFDLHKLANSWIKTNEAE